MFPAAFTKLVHKSSLSLVKSRPEIHYPPLAAGGAEVSALAGSRIVLRDPGDIRNDSAPDFTCTRPVPR